MHHKQNKEETKKMKKLITIAVCALGMTIGAVAAETQYKVYDLSLSLKVASHPLLVETNTSIA